MCDFLDILQFDGRILYTVQFPNILTTDNVLTLGDASYPVDYTVADLVADNPQFFLAKGIAGIETLYSTVMEPGKDLTIKVERGPNTITANAAFVGGRPSRPIAH